MKDVVSNMLNEKSKRRKRIMVSIDDLVPSAENKNYPMIEIENLAESLRNNGQINPLIICPRTDERYDILSGERRYRAAKLNCEQGYSDWEDLECIIDDRDLSQFQRRCSIRLANCQRESIPIENKIEIVRECMNDYQYAKKQELIPVGTLQRDWIAQQTGFSARSIQDYMNLINNDDDEKHEEAIDKEMLIRVLCYQSQKEIPPVVLTVNELKEAVRAASYPGGSFDGIIYSITPKGISFNEHKEIGWSVVLKIIHDEYPEELEKEKNYYFSVEKDMNHFLNAKVSIKNSKIEIDYSNKEDLKRILRLLKKR